jgi:hypothetical protein
MHRLEPVAGFSPFRVNAVCYPPSCPTHDHEISLNVHRSRKGATHELALTNIKVLGTHYTQPILAHPATWLAGVTGLVLHLLSLAATWQF